MRRFLRYLRIAFSVTCGIACVLMIGLWVRSYWWMDQFGGPLSPTRILLVGSIEGGLLVQCPFHDWGYNWNVKSNSLKSGGRSSFRFGNEFRRIPDGFCLPHWSLVVLYATLTAVPWIRRFSLRTLLIATTLVALVLGRIVYVVR
jgi:hypothetical protein